MLAEGAVTWRRARAGGDTGIASRLLGEKVARITVAVAVLTAVDAVIVLRRVG